MFFQDLFAASCLEKPIFMLPRLLIHFAVVKCKYQCWGGREVNFRGALSYGRVLQAWARRKKTPNLGKPLAGCGGSFLVISKSVI